MSRYFKKNKGFTLVEAIVTISIVMIIFTIIINRQSDYSDELLLTYTADELNLSITEAQAYSVGSQVSSEETIYHGISIQVAESMYISGAGEISGSEDSYIRFADDLTFPPYDRYSDTWDCPEVGPQGNDGECEELINLVAGNKIYATCVIYYDESEDCTMGRLDIVFKEEANPNFSFMYGPGYELTPTQEVKGAKIILLSPKGSIKSVLIYSTGQISVQ